jgi:hypothetical protein
MNRRATLFLAALLTAAGLPGCIEQRYVIESEPPGALVLVNGQPIGTTPVDGYFVYYGTYNFTLVKDGYQTKVVQQKIAMPWFEYPGIDFFTENVYPAKVEDVRRFKYCLEPLVQVSEGDLLQQAQQLRERGKAVNGGEPPQQP